MKDKAIRAGWIVSMGLLPALSEAQMVSLFLEPGGAAPIAQVDLADPALVEGSAVLEAGFADQGWWWGEYTSVFTGYVDEADLDAQGNPRPGAIARAEPDDDAPVLSVIARRTPFQVLARGDWVTVRYEGAVSVYFQKRAAPDGISPTAQNAMTADSAGSRAIGRSNMEGTRIAEGATDTPPPPQPTEVFPQTQTTLAPPPATGEPPPPAFASTTAAPAIVPSPSPGAMPADSLARRLEGTLRKSGARLGFFRPRYDFYLEGADGKRRAWLTLQNRITPGALEQFLDQPVLIVGEVTEVAGSAQPVIDVQLLTGR